MLDFLNKILEFPSISGNEEYFIKEWSGLIGGLCDRTWVDNFGNCISAVNEKAEKSILINAHCDEIGLMATKINDNGTIKFKALGTHDAAVLYGQRVKILGKRQVTGLIQLQRKLEKKDSEIKMEDLLIDIGSDSGSETRKLVDIGSYIQLASIPETLQDGKIMANGLDDKAGLAVLYFLMKNINKEMLPSLCIYFAATLREEINSGGAVTLASDLMPDYSLSIDVTETNDTTETKSNDCALSLGKGPAILRCPILDRRLENILIRSAENISIKVQYEASPYLSFTDADAIHKVRKGVPSTVLSIPVRYIHTSNEVISLNDLENTAKLTMEFLRELDRSVSSK